MITLLFLLFCFLLWNLIWLYYRFSVFAPYLKNDKLQAGYTGLQYTDEDNPRKFTYTVYEPTYLLFNGAISITEGLFFEKDESGKTYVKNKYGTRFTERINLTDTARAFAIEKISDIEGRAEIDSFYIEVNEQGELLHPEEYDQEIISLQHACEPLMLEMLDAARAFWNLPA